MKQALLVCSMMIVHHERDPRFAVLGFQVGQPAVKYNVMYRGINSALIVYIVKYAANIGCQRLAEVPEAYKIV